MLGSWSIDLGVDFSIIVLTLSGIAKQFICIAYFGKHHSGLLLGFFRWADLKKHQCWVLQTKGHKTQRWAETVTTEVHPSDETRRTLPKEEPTSAALLLPSIVSFNSL